MTRYFTLLTQQPDKTWGVEFGSYKRSEITFEKESLHDGYERIPYTKMYVLETGDTQQEIQAAVDQLNNIPPQTISETVDI